MHQFVDLSSAPSRPAVVPQASPRPGVDPSRLTRLDAVDLLSCQTTVLSLISSGAALPLVLDAIAGGLEQLMPDTRCGVLVMDDRGHLRRGSAPSFGPEFAMTVGGLRPGPTAGSSGAAAYLRSEVVVSDIETDLRLSRYRKAARAAGVRACWSTPVFGAGGEVVGTVAVYYSSVTHPSARQRVIVDQLTHLAAVAINHAAAVGEVTLSRGHVRTLFEDNAVAMALLSDDGTIVRANDALRALAARAVVLGRTHLADVVVDDGELTARLRDLRVGRRGEARVELPVRGRERTVALSLSVVRESEDEPLRISVTMLDVSHQLLAQRAQHARREADLARRSAEASTRDAEALLSDLGRRMQGPVQQIADAVDAVLADGSASPTSDRARHVLVHGVAELRQLAAAVPVAP